MWEEAPKIELFGIQVYTFGLYCMIGALCAVGVVCVLSRAEKLKRGAGTVSSCLGIFCGMLCSRLVFCILNDVSVGGVPIQQWLNISDGGWSMYGLIFGVFLGIWLSSLITKVNCGTLLDIASCALPLLIAAERYGEKLFEGFDVSRQLQKGCFPEGTFLAVRDSYYEGVSFMATWLVAAIAAVILFLVLVFFLTRERRQDGDLWILFMLLCGAGGIILESLRYDHYLEYSFVCFQQIMAAILLVLGVILAGIRNRKAKKGILLAAIISLPVAIALCGGIEFALDRMSISHYVLYAIMAAALAVPVTLGIILLRKRERGAE